MRCSGHAIAFPTAASTATTPVSVLRIAAATAIAAAAAAATKHVHDSAEDAGTLCHDLGDGLQRVAFPLPLTLSLHCKLSLLGTCSSSLALGINVLIRVLRLVPGGLS